MTLPLAPTAYDVLCARHAGAAARLLDALLPIEHEAGRDLSAPLERAEAELRPAHDAGEVTAASFRPRLLDSVRRQVEPVGTGDSAVARAWAALSPAAQGTIWLGEVEGWRDAAARADLDPAELAEPGAAREELAAAIVAAHADDATREACRRVRTDLLPYVRAELAHSEMIRVAAHLECCRRCTALYLELSEAHSDVAGLIAPVVLGGAAAAYLASMPAPHEPSARERLAGYVASQSLRGLVAVAAATVLVAGLALAAGSGVLGGNGDSTSDAPVAAPPPAVTAPDAPRSARPGQAATSTVASTSTAGSTVRAVSAEGSSSPTAGPTAGPTSTPTVQPTVQPTTRPTARPTLLPTAVPTLVPPTVAPTQSVTPVEADDPALAVSLDPVAAVSLGPGGLAVSSTLLATSLQLGSSCGLIALSATTC